MYCGGSVMYLIIPLYSHTYDGIDKHLDKLELINVSH